jgi:hypothetical protein
MKEDVGELEVLAVLRSAQLLSTGGRRALFPGPSHASQLYSCQANRICFIITSISSTQENFTIFFCQSSLFSWYSRVPFPPLASAPQRFPNIGLSFHPTQRTKLSGAAPVQSAGRHVRRLEEVENSGKF